MQHVAEEQRLDLVEGNTDWTTLSVPKVLNYLIAESPEFEKLLSDVLCTSAPHNFHTLAATCLSCGGDRLMSVCHAVATAL